MVYWYTKAPELGLRGHPVGGEQFDNIRLNERSLGTNLVRAYDRRFPVGWPPVAHLALFITLAALLVQVLGFALWCTVREGLVQLKYGVITQVQEKEPAHSTHSTRA